MTNNDGRKLVHFLCHISHLNIRTHLASTFQVLSKTPLSPMGQIMFEHNTADIDANKMKQLKLRILQIDELDFLHWLRHICTPRIPTPCLDPIIWDAVYPQWNSNQSTCG